MDAPTENRLGTQAPTYNLSALSELVEAVDFASAGDGVRALAGQLAGAMAPALALGPNALCTLLVKALQQWQVEYGQPADAIAAFAVPARIEALRSVCGKLGRLLTPAVSGGALDPALEAGFRAFERSLAEA